MSNQRCLLNLPALTADQTNACFELQCFPLHWSNPRQLGWGLLANNNPWEKPAVLWSTINGGTFVFYIWQTGKVAKFILVNNFQCFARQKKSLPKLVSYWWAQESETRRVTETKGVYFITEVTLLNANHSGCRQKPHVYGSGECHNLVLLRTLSSVFAKTWNTSSFTADS